MSPEQGEMQQLRAELAAHEAQLQRQHEEVLRAVKIALEQSFAAERAQLLDRVESLTQQLAMARAPHRVASPTAQSFGSLGGEVAGALTAPYSFTVEAVTVSDFKVSGLHIPNFSLPGFNVTGEIPLGAEGLGLGAVTGLAMGQTQACKSGADVDPFAFPPPVLASDGTLLPARDTSAPPSFVTDSESEAESETVYTSSEGSETETDSNSSNAEDSSEDRSESDSEDDTESEDDSENTTDGDSGPDSGDDGASGPGSLTSSHASVMPSIYAATSDSSEFDDERAPKVVTSPAKSSPRSAGFLRGLSIQPRGSAAPALEQRCLVAPITAPTDTKVSKESDQAAADAPVQADAKVQDAAPAADSEPCSPAAASSGDPTESGSAALQQAMNGAEAGNESGNSDEDWQLM